jgi:putative acyl-CoA dehydrogenase
MPPTHEVFNQPPALTGYDVSDDAAMLAALRREGAGWAEEAVRELGRLAGSPQVQEQGRLANENPPKLRTHDRFGHRVDEVEFHPAWHELMTVAVRHGLHAAPWRDARPGAHVARAAGFYVWSAAEAGHGCPVSMTYAIVPALRHAPGLAGRFEPLLAAPEYDFGLRPPLTKRGLLAGMSMTEKQGGSDVRANTTRAVPAGTDQYLLTGHKWFTSAPMGDLFLVLAQAPGGLSCFLLPRVRPDGTRNGMRLQRLKDKLGNRSNASAEVEYDEALAWLVGEEGRGVRTIIEMVNMTRLDCVLGTATGMRAGVTMAAHHAAHRMAFGRALAGQPLMASVLADLAIESEATTLAAFRLAGATDRAARGDGQEAAFRRLALAATKYWVCKRAPAHAAEALECLGGNGYIEESGNAAPVPGGAAGLDLGGFGQRRRARRAARPDQAARVRRGAVRRARPGRRGGRPAGPGGRPAAQGTRRPVRSPRPACRRSHRAGPAGCPARPLRRPGRGRRVRRVPPGRRRRGFRGLGPRLRHAPGRRRHRGHRQPRHAPPHGLSAWPASWTAPPRRPT